MTALYSTNTRTIRGTPWRFAIRADNGRGEFQWQDGNAWRGLATYPHRKLGLITLAELHRLIYEPQAGNIRAARRSAEAMPAGFELRAPHIEVQLKLV